MAIEYLMATREELLVETTHLVGRILMTSPGDAM